jgi:hypothetical protein
MVNRCQLYYVLPITFCKGHYTRKYKEKQWFLPALRELSCMKNSKQDSYEIKRTS